MAFYNGKQGKWITTETGSHIFIEDGQSIEEAMKDRFDESYEEDLDYDGNFDPEPEDINFKGKITVQKGSFSDTRKWFDDAFVNREYVNEDVDLMINNFLKKNYGFKIKLKNTNQGRASHYDAKTMSKVVIDTGYKPDDISLIGTFYHEMGHAMDHKGHGDYYSLSYVSTIHNKTMIDMLDEEFKANLDENTLKNLADNIINARDHSNYYKEQLYLDELFTSMGDIVQNVFGKDTCKKLFNGYLGHDDLKDGKEYFSYKQLRATEVFAELTSNLGTDPNKYLIDIFRKYAPKTLEIYEEIVEAIK